MISREQIDVRSVGGGSFEDIEHIIRIEERRERKDHSGNQSRGDPDRRELEPLIVLPVIVTKPEHSTDIRVRAGRLHDHIAPEFRKECV